MKYLLSLTCAGGQVGVLRSSGGCIVEGLLPVALDGIVGRHALSQSSQEILQLHKL